MWYNNMTLKLGRQRSAREEKNRHAPWGWDGDAQGGNQLWPSGGFLVLPERPAHTFQRNDLPQPQLSDALGFEILKPPPIRVST